MSGFLCSFLGGAHYGKQQKPISNKTDLIHFLDRAGQYGCHADSEGSNFRGALQNAEWLFKQCLIWAKNQFVLERQDYQWQHETILYGWKPGAAHNFYVGRKQGTVIEEAAPISVRKDDNGVLLTFTVGIQTITIGVPYYEVLQSGDDSISTVWRFDKPLRNGEHPTMKPIGLCARAI